MRRPAERFLALLPRLALLGILAGCAGSEPCTRLAISGLVSPLPEELPAPGMTLQELPPLGRAGVCADGAHGGTLMAIDAQRFFCAQGELLPGWCPLLAPTAPLDAAALAGQVQALGALLQAFTEAVGEAPLPATRRAALSTTLTALARSLGAVLGACALDDAAGQRVNARDAHLLQAQAQARLRRGPVADGVIVAAPPPLLVYDAAREWP
jgi:hypothetical protein